MLASIHEPPETTRESHSSYCSSIGCCGLKLESKAKAKMKKRIEAWENHAKTGNMFEALMEIETEPKECEGSEEAKSSERKVKEESEAKASGRTVKEEGERTRQRSGCSRARPPSGSKFAFSEDERRRLVSEAQAKLLATAAEELPDDHDELIGRPGLEFSSDEEGGAVGSRPRPPARDTNEATRKKKRTRNQRRKEKAPGENDTKKKRSLLDMMTEEFKRQARDEANKLCLFEQIEPEGVNAIQGEVKWELLTLYVDSGATETVIAETMLNMMELKESPQSLRGVEYQVANGTKIPNLGQKLFVTHAEDGTKRQVLAQVCEVNKALLSVSKMVNHGNKVVFGEIDGQGNRISYIEDNVTKERLWIEEENGMYALKVWVRSDGKEAEAPF